MEVKDYKLNKNTRRNNNNDKTSDDLFYWLRRGGSRKYIETTKRESQVEDQ